MKNQVKYLTDVLEAKGYRLTIARQIIAETLVDSGSHCSADELVDLVHKSAPGIGRMTVYRTLELFCHLGLVRPIYQGTGAAHYVLMERGHHHHLVCSACGRFIEFDDCVLEKITEELISERFNFAVEGHLLELFGRCQQCQEQYKSSERL